MTDLLQIEALSIRVGNTLVRAPDLRLAAGESVALVGRSGSGKSLAGLAVLGLLPAAAHIETGRILLRGEAISDLPERRHAALQGSTIGMVFQHPRSALHPSLRIGLQLADVLAVHRRLSGTAAMAEAARLLREVGLGGRERARAAELSGGQCQRVTIALALAARPVLLIADEPTSALDAASAAAMMELIASHTASRGMALLLITHDRALAARWCARVVTMDGDAIPPPLPRRAPAIAATTPLLQVAGLHKRFALGRGWIRAVDGASFTIGRGEAVGLVGPSGCGKSTLAALLARLVDADAGTIRFEHTDIARTPARAAARAPWRRDVQMVFQDAGDALDPRHTVLQAVQRPLARLLGLSGTALADRTGQALHDAGLPRDLHGRRPHQLSGGQRARAGLARAIAPAPALLILDEPTAALDPEAQAQILDLLAGLQQQRGLALLLIAHDLALVRSLCSRVLVMEAGRLVSPDFSPPSHRSRR